MTTSRSTWEDQPGPSTHRADYRVDVLRCSTSNNPLATKLHLAVDTAGLPPPVVLTPGQADDNSQLLPLLDDIPDIPDIDLNGQRVRAGRVIAGKAHAHPSTRTALRQRRINAAIPERIDRIDRRKAKARQWQNTALLPRSVQTSQRS
ncbi:transposase, partial [Lentzea jiangxiensis]|uniref:transposase n=1 Tax=Lentzea jiangxiensis TaxID=641025 RepID=UPI001C40B4F7